MTLPLRANDVPPRYVAVGGAKETFLTDLRQQLFPDGRG